MKSWKVWTAFILVFVLGVTCGVFGSGYAVKHRLKTFKGLKGGAFGGKRFLERIERQVRPDSQTMEQITGIVHQHQKKLRAVRDRALQERMTIFNDTKKQITPLLTPDEKVRFERLVERIHKRFQRVKLMRSLQQ